MLSRLDYSRLSGFYFFYFALLGAYIPFWSLYLEGRGFSALQIGYLSGAVLATKIIAPSVWGHLADRSGQRLQIVRLGALLALLSFCAIYLDEGFSWLLVVVLAYSFFWNAILAQFEVITLDHLGTDYNRYSQVRVWGSIGFIGAVLLLGWLFDRIAIDNLPALMALVLAGIWLGSLLVHDAPPSHRPTSAGGLGSVLRRRPVWSFLLACFLLQLAHGPYYTFFSLYLDSLDYSRSTIGQLWALGVIAEVVLFLFMHRLLPRFGIRNIMIACLCLAVLRWVLTAYFADVLSMLVFAQLLHAATFGAFHAVSIELIRRNFPPHLAGQGQAIYSGVSFGAGGAVGAVVSGYLWSYGAQQTFVAAAVASLLACLLAWRYIHDSTAQADS